MSEEELKAIEYTKSILKFPKLYASTETDGSFLRGIDKEKLDTLLNLIEKQQKEIENSVSKDKIIDKIKEIKDYIEEFKPQGYIEDELNAKISVLEELLGEEEHEK